MKKKLIPLLLLFATACSPILTVTPLPLTTSTVTNGLPFAMTPPASPKPGGIIGIPTIHTSLPPEPPESVWLRILSPIDGQVVNIPQVEVIGEAAAGAVVTVNDEILIIGGDQKFSVILPLVEGPNLIEIVASDVSGSEMTMELVVIYEP